VTTGMTASAFDPAAVPGALANRVLDREAWARQRLAGHAGRSFVIAVGPAASAFAIDEAGRVVSTSAGPDMPDLRLSVSPLDLPAFLADPTRWDRYVSAEGDPALATTLKELAPTLPWFVEQAFAGVLGNVLGQQVADTGRRLLAFPEYAAERMGASVASFAHERSGLLATGDEGRTFAEQVNALAASVDALAARIDALADRVPERPALREVGKGRRPRK
jgi:ubiquinone biosynthesis accessory factor UbiJ